MQGWPTPNFLSFSNSSRGAGSFMTEGDGMKMNELHFSNKSEQEYTIMDSVEKF
jgi:hypothetical protein